MSINARTVRPSHATGSGHFMVEQRGKFIAAFTNEADARQFAAAPEMLELLEEVIGIDYAVDAIGPDYLAKIRAVIAKVAGESA